MKKLLLLFSLLVLNPSLFAQVWLWGGEGSSQSDTYAVAADVKGNGYLAGGFSPSITFGKITLSSSYPDSYLVKYDSSGNVIWGLQTKSLTSYSSARIVYISTDVYGNIYATGYFSGQVVLGTDTITDSLSATYDFFLAKYNQNGKVLWVRQSNVTTYPNEGQGEAVATDNIGNVYVSGFFQNEVSFGLDTLKSPYTQPEMFAVKYDSAGKLLWAANANSPKACFGYSICGDKSGNAYIAGSYTDTITFGSFMFNSLAEDMFLVKYDAAGKMVWVKRASQTTSNDQAWGNSVITDGAGYVYVTGGFIDTIAFGINKLAASGLGTFLAKFSSAGNVVWVKQVAPARSQEGYCLAADSLEHIYFSGSMFSSSSSDPDPSLIIEFDSSGRALCSSTIVTGGDDNNGIAVSPSGQYVYVGGDIITNVIFGNDTLLEHGGEPPFIARWKPCKPNLQAVDELKPSGTEITVYPNPCNGLFTIQVKSEELIPIAIGTKSTVEVYNVLGEKVYSQYSIPNTQYQINLKGQPAGVYFVRVYDNEQKFIATAKVVIQ